MPSSTFLNLPAEKQEKLLEAATREFSHRPFNEASINQIIKEAGIPRGSFYMYFQDKEDLFRYLLKGYVDQLFMLLEEFLLRAQGDIFQALLDLYDFVQAKTDQLDLGEIGAMISIIRCNSGMQKNSLLEMLDPEVILRVAAVERLADSVNAGAVKVLRPLPDLGGGRHIGRDAGEVLGVLFHQGVHIIRVHVPGAALSAAIDHHLDQVGTQLLELGVHVVLHAVAQARDDDDGCHADDDAQHGQQCPHLAEHQGLDGQLEGLGKVHASSSSPASSSSWGWTTAWGSLASPS